MTVRLLWRAWGAVMLLLGLPVLLWGGGGPPDLGDEAAGNESFALPELRSGQPAADDLQQLAASSLWGAAGAATGAAESSAGTGATAPWSLVGVYAKDRISELVLTFAEEGKAPQRLRPGDTLPDGRIVTVIERDRVGVAAPGAPTATDWIHVNRQGQQPGAAN